MKKSINSFLMVFLCFCISGCTVTPNETTKNGILMSDKKENDDFISTESNLQKTSSGVGEFLEFPNHVSEEIKGADSILNINADIIIPSAENIYSGKGRLIDWNTENELVSQIVDGLKEKRMILPDCPMEIISLGADSASAMVYYNKENQKLEKKGDMSPDFSEENIKDFTSICNEAGVDVQLQSSDNAALLASNYVIAQMWNNIPFSTGFPTTGRSDIPVLGGRISFFSEGISEFVINGFVYIDSYEECNILVDWDDIHNSLEQSLKTNEIFFDENMIVNNISLEYFVQSVDNEVDIIPVWRFYFDIDSFYEKIENQSGDEYPVSMMELCIDARDGSVVFAV